MNPEQLYDGITQIRDDLIEAPITPGASKPQPKGIRWIAGIAAVLALLILMPALGGSGGGGSQSGQIYMGYSGPVFPLDVEGGSLTATRLTDYDLSPMDGQINHSYVDQYGNTVTYQYGGYEAVVTDSYTLTNDTDAPVTVKAIYPFAASLEEDIRVLPRITVDGIAAETELRMGQTEEDLLFKASWENYKNLLEDGSYRQTALGTGLTSDQPVTVYEILNTTTPEDAGNPTLQFTAEPADGSFLLSYGSAGGTHDPEHGGVVRQFPMKQVSAPRYVVVLGEDITGYSVQCYRDGSCDSGEEIHAAWEVRRTESTLGQLLAQLYRLYRTGWGNAAEPDILDSVPGKAMLALMARYMAEHGPEAGCYPGRNVYDDISDLFADLDNRPRVLYLTFTVTVPAHGQTQVSAAMHRKGHSDYTGKKQDRCGFDLTTGLGSRLTFTEQRASLSNWEDFRIVDQNFGFDLRRGVTTVTLDPQVEYYWMDIRGK